MLIQEINPRHSNSLFLIDGNLGLTDAKCVYSKSNALNTITSEMIRVINETDDDNVSNKMREAMGAVVDAFLIRDGWVYVENDGSPDYRTVTLSGDEVAVMDGEKRVDGRDADELGLSQDTWGFERCAIMSKQDAVLDLNDEWKDELSEKGLRIGTFEDLIANLAIVEDITSNEYVWE